MNDVSRFVRPDGQRFIRPDGERYLSPDGERYLRPDWRDRKYWVGEPPPAHVTDQEWIDGTWRKKPAGDIGTELAELRAELDAIKADLRRKANFDPDQPRVPAGNPDGGQWTNDTGGAGRTPVAQGVSDEISSSRRAPGHHFVPRSVYRDLPLRPETRRVFEEATTGPLHAERHGWSAEHQQYNRAVRQQLERFMERSTIRPEQMTPDQARTFVAEIRRSSDPRIRDYNLRIFRPGLQYLLRRGPRGRE